MSCHVMSCSFFVLIFNFLWPLDRATEHLPVCTNRLYLYPHSFRLSISVGFVLLAKGDFRPPTLTGALPLYLPAYYNTCLWAPTAPKTLPTFVPAQTETAVSLPARRRIGTSVHQRVQTSPRRSLNWFRMAPPRNSGERLLSKTSFKNFFQDLFQRLLSTQVRSVKYYRSHTVTLFFDTWVLEVQILTVESQHPFAPIRLSALDPPWKQL